MKQLEFVETIAAHVGGSEDLLRDALEKIAPYLSKEERVLICVELGHFPAHVCPKNYPNEHEPNGNIIFNPRLKGAVEMACNRCGRVGVFSVNTNDGCWENR